MEIYGRHAVDGRYIHREIRRKGQHVGWCFYRQFASYKAALAWAKAHIYE